MRGKKSNVKFLTLVPINVELTFSRFSYCTFYFYYFDFKDFFVLLGFYKLMASTTFNNHIFVFFEIDIRIIQKVEHWNRTEFGWSTTRFWHLKRHRNKLFYKKFNWFYTRFHDIFSKKYEIEKNEMKTIGFFFSSQG